MGDNYLASEEVGELAGLLIDNMLKNHDGESISIASLLKQFNGLEIETIRMACTKIIQAIEE